ncbi:UNVERIFIED_CONTAM: hypothetical protein O8I53_08405 [Campylobacter lari]
MQKIASMANNKGGIIVLGFKQSNKNNEIELVDTNIDSNLFDK